MVEQVHPHPATGDRLDPQPVGAEGVGQAGAAVLGGEVGRLLAGHQLDGEGGRWPEADLPDPWGADGDPGGDGDVLAQSDPGAGFAEHPAQRVGEDDDRGLVLAAGPPLAEPGEEAVGAGAVGAPGAVLEAGGVLEGGHQAAPRSWQRQHIEPSTAGIANSSEQPGHIGPGRRRVGDSGRRGRRMTLRSPGVVAAQMPRSGRFPPRRSGTPAGPGTGGRPPASATAPHGRGVVRPWASRGEEQLRVLVAAGAAGLPAHHAASPSDERRPWRCGPAGARRRPTRETSTPLPSRAARTLTRSPSAPPAEYGSSLGPRGRRNGRRTAPACRRGRAGAARPRRGTGRRCSSGPGGRPAVGRWGCPPTPMTGAT